ncbi:DUF1697 domain-containing protein [Paenilisteria rocourtiae]|uniref:Uncharacterized protein (DUF1697 family) n=1 Tax=Listeria rocourtiae TaxID=647910 RepID=A0A4R6ZQR3_9LIST|nr:DUF1697 domain-containing protein [Listeria rocourtiae]EUJ48474.1 hypothetical protein PROCOU_06028 [Listeria rocourtiae FSL F6-920]MBC1606119.1 DUF1697 domain-containing protein [Listeria rocourtiae]TDR54835.1 uncharacterized protein (DUF1697 family) [Listeria rocourtiae]
MKYIIFLRAINVGGTRKIKMADLKEAFLSEGYQNVITYIQSGNVIAEKEQMNHEFVQQGVEALIKKHFDFEVPVVAFKPSEYEEVLRQNPFGEEKVMVHFLDKLPKESAVDKLLELNASSPDQAAIVGRFLYVSLKAGVSDSVYSNKFVEKVLQVRATARNWNTVLKMSEKLNNLS